MNKKLIMIGSAVVFAVASVMASTFVTDAAPIAMAVCPVFNHSLSIGVIGSDVTALQNYLNAQGYLSVSATGYFGPLTQSAVARWQAQGGVVGLGGSGSGIFGPLSRAYFARSCVVGVPGSGSGGGSSSPTSTQNVLQFSGTPSSGIAPLTVQFTVSAPQGTTVGNSVNFGDSMTGNLGFTPVCSSCNLLAVVSHTYTAPGIYTATLMNGACSCPANGVCNCPNLMILATTTVAVTAPNASSSNPTSTIQQLDSPASVTLYSGGIAEVRNDNFYFTLSSVTASSAIINVTAVGCWNSFPSDPTPEIHCMIAVVPIPPQTLSIGQKYEFGTTGITLTSITNDAAIFSVQ